MSHGAPSGTLLGVEQLGYAGGIATAPAAYGYAEIAPAVTAVHETIEAGPAVAETVVHHGVVGSRTVQVSDIWLILALKTQIILSF